MSTDLQLELAEAIIVNQKLPIRKRKNKKELVASVGYAASTTAHKQTSIIEAKGVKDALREFGLTEQLITTALVRDIKKKPGKRERELRLGAEILGMKDIEKGNTTNVFVQITGMKIIKQ